MEELMIDWCVKEESRRRIFSFSQQSAQPLSIQFWAIKDTRKKQDSRTPLFVEYCYVAIKDSTKFYYMVENSIQFLIYTEIKAPNSSYLDLK